MNIAILTPLFFHSVAEVHGKDRIVFGGAERYMVDLCNLLKSQGHNPIVYQAFEDKQNVAPTILEKSYKGIPVKCIKINSAWDYGVNPELNMNFNELAGGADLRIYFATYLAYPYAKRPCISISHGIWYDYPSYMFQCSTEQVKKDWFLKQLDGFTQVDVCVSCDSNTKRVIAATAAGKENRIQIVHNYVDTYKFKPVEKNNEKVNVLYPRRLTTLRGCNEFIAASQKYPQYNYKAVGQAANESAEEGLKQQMRNVPQIEFTHVEMDGMEKMYDWADISVIPTTACEGLSLSLLESMASGLPIITTPVGGISDAVIPNYNALVFDPQHENLGDYIDYLAKDKSLRESFSRRNREIAMESFDIRIWQTKWMDLINQFGGSNV